MWEYCLVLEAGCEDLGWGVNNEVLFQQADAEGQVPGRYGVEVGRDRKRLLSEHLKEKGGAPDEMDDAILALMLCDAQSLTHWRGVVEVAVAAAAALNLLHAGVVLANLGELLWGELDGGEEGDQEAVVAVADDDQQLENGCGTQEPLLLHAQALRRAPRHAADENFAAAQGVVLAQAVAAVAVEQQLMESGGEYWESEMAKNAHCLHGALKLAAGMLCQQELDLVQREIQSVGEGCYFLTDCNFESFLRGAAGFDSRWRRGVGAEAEAGQWCSKLVGETDCKRLKLSGKTVTHWAAVGY